MCGIFDYVKLMLSQHIGAVAVPLVAVGCDVKKGQLIAVCEGLGANIHSSVYGMVDEVSADAITIKCVEHQPDEYLKIKDTASFLDAVKEAGIVGAGGAGFPAHVKFNVNLDGGCVILNAAECEPTLLHNIQVLTDDADTIIRGMRYVMEMTNAAKGYVAVKAKNAAAVAAVKKACGGDDTIEIKLLPDAYPVGDERAILAEVLGVQLGPGQLPSAVGALVSNVETIKRVVEAIELRKPVITKDFTVGGRLYDTHGKTGQVFLDQPIGAPIKKYIESCGGLIPPVGEIVLGGAFTGARGNEDSVITKLLGGIFAASPYPTAPLNFGILACECGAQEERLREIVTAMGGTVVAEKKCKRMIEHNGRWRCAKPGACPGQAEIALALKMEGAEASLVGACED